MYSAAARRQFMSFLVAVTAFRRPHIFRLMAPLAGLVRPILAESGYLPPLFGLVTGGAGHFLHILVLFVGEGDISVFGVQDDNGIIRGAGNTGTENGQGYSCDNPFHVRSPYFWGDVLLRLKEYPRLSILQAGGRKKV
jgi:hypothetical protein